MATSIQHYKVAILGEVGVGKSNFAYMWVCGIPYDNYDPTGGVEPKVLQYESRSYDIDFLGDQGDIDSLRPEFWDLVIRQCDGFILMYDITSRHSFEKIPGLYLRIFNKKTNAGGLLVQIPICLVGNKIDQDASREVSTEKAAELALRLHCGFVETSAIKGEGVYEAMLELIRWMKRAQDQASSSVPSP